MRKIFVLFIVVFTLCITVNVFAQTDNNKLEEKKNPCTENVTLSQYYKVYLARDNAYIFVGLDEKKNYIAMIEGSEVHDENLFGILCKPEISCFVFTGTSGITSSGLNTLLSKHQNLKGIVLRSAYQKNTKFDKITINFFNAFENHRKLTHIHLKNASLGGQGQEYKKSLSKLGVLKELTALSLQNCKIKGDVIRHVSKLPKLKSLELDGNIINDNDLKLLSGNGCIETLSLSGDGISDESLPTFLSIKKLMDLRLENTLFSQEAVNRLKKEKPRIRVWTGIPISPHRKVDP